MKAGMLRPEMLPVDWSPGHCKSFVEEDGITVLVVCHYHCLEGVQLCVTYSVMSQTVYCYKS